MALSAPAPDASKALLKKLKQPGPPEGKGVNDPNDETDEEDKEPGGAAPNRPAPITGAY